MSFVSKILLAILMVGVAFAALLVLARAAQRHAALARWEQGLFEAIGPALAPRWSAAFADVSALGSSTLVGLFGAGFAIAAWALGRPLEAGVLAASSVLPGLIGRALKRWTQRPRPSMPGAPHFGSSMPSNHTVMAGCLWGSAALVLGLWGPPVQGQVTLAALAILLVLAVGATRVLLRVHFASDVVAGWLFAAVWVGAMGVILAGA